MDSYDYEGSVVTDMFQYLLVKCLQCILNNASFNELLSMDVLFSFL